MSINNSERPLSVLIQHSTYFIWLMRSLKRRRLRYWMKNEELKKSIVWAQLYRYSVICIQESGIQFFLILRKWNVFLKDKHKRVQAHSPPKLTKLHSSDEPAAQRCSSTYLNDCQDIFIFVFALWCISPWNRIFYKFSNVIYSFNNCFLHSEN